MPISEANYYSTNVGTDTGANVVNPNESNYRYGGTGEGEFGHMAADALRRQAPVTNYANADQSRGQVMQGLGLAHAAAMGQAPSVAQQQAYAGQDAAVQNAAAVAAGGRGAPIGNQQAAQAAQYGLFGQVNAQGAMARGQEIADARNAYAQGAFGLRGQDTQQAQYLAQLQAAQNQANQKYALGLQTMGQGASVAQQKANQAYIQQVLANQHAQANVAQDVGATGAAIHQDEQDAQGNIVKGIYGAVPSIIGALI